MTTLLVAVDTSDIAEKVLIRAENFGRQLGAKVVLLHVVEPVAEYIPFGASMDAMPVPAAGIDFEEETTVAKARLERFATPMRARGVHVHCHTALGAAVDEILDQARVQGAEYIMLGSHGHGALFHLFNGNVVTGILRHAICPVIVVPVRA